MTHEKTDPATEPSTTERGFDLSVREAASRDMMEARILVNRIFREYRDSGGRTELDRLLRRRENLPWYLKKAETPR